MKEETFTSDFIELSKSVNALLFGEFHLKSGRVSPYFFNSAKFNNGNSLWKMAECYVEKIIYSKIDFDVIFGPAYKGIPLVSAISIILSQRTGKAVPWAFNRKESKKHGEGGMLVGSEVKGNVLIVDDVITAGTAIKEVFDTLSETDAKITDVLVALDRQEVAPNSRTSAMYQIGKDYGIKTHSVIKLDDLINYSIRNSNANLNTEKLKEYRERYGVNI